MSDARPFDMPPVSSGFDARAGWLMDRLMAEPSLGLSSPFHAAAIVGNLGGESGLRAVNESHPMVPGSRGGWSWAQWTADRRDAFEAYATARHLPLGSDRVAYEFLIKELAGSEKQALDQTKKTTTLDAAVYTFEVMFERPSDPEGGLPSRIAFARRALAAAGHAVPPLPPVVQPPSVAEPDLDNTLIDSIVRALQAALALEGLYDGKIDGLPGAKTYQALDDYAAQRGQA